MKMYGKVEKTFSGSSFITIFVAFYMFSGNQIGWPFSSDNNTDWELIESSVSDFGAGESEQCHFFELIHVTTGFCCYVDVKRKTGRL